MERYNYNWYILSCLKRDESKISERIKNELKVNGLSEHLKSILIVTKKIKKKENFVFKNIYPGYLYIHASLTPELVNVINSVEGVYGFLNQKNRYDVNIPIVPRKDILKIKKEISTFDSINPVYDIRFKTGDLVKILNHSLFKNQMGKITHIDRGSGKINLKVNFMNKIHHLVVDYNDIRK